MPESIEILLASEDDQRSQLLNEARVGALLLPGVSETSLYDGFCRHWTPAYYSGSSQLFHIHNFRGGLRATVFTKGHSLVEAILDSDRVPEALRNQLAKNSQSKGVKQVKVELRSVEDVMALLELANLKHQSLR